MKNIEYRGIRKDTGKWVYGYYVYHVKRTPSPINDYVKSEDEQHMILNDSFSDWNMPREIEYFEVIPETVGQYIGIRDKFKTKIYEDDTLVLMKDTSEGPIVLLETIVKWSEQGLNYNIYPNNDEKYWVVVGNIHER